MIRRSTVDDPVLDSITNAIVARFHPRRIVLFGSRARGNARPDSDYDLMVEMDSTLPMPERAMAIDRLFGMRDWSMDVFVFTPREVSEMRDRIGSLVHSIEHDGVAIYEQS